jgi:hypothetical protein
MEVFVHPKEPGGAAALQRFCKEEGPGGVTAIAAERGSVGGALDQERHRLLTVRQQLEVRHGGVPPRLSNAPVAAL